ncbi:MAG: N-acetylmuramic acid 6-phosphate etherase [Candidatus Zixiibacteriota bacterium]
MSDYDELIKALGRLQTEQVNRNTINIDRLPALEIVRKISDEDKKVASAVEKRLAEIAAAAEIFAQTIAGAGRVFYIGAGTSGRLGVLDAAECPPTFGTDPKQIIGVISGGYDTLVLSKEGVEDSREAAVADLKSHNFASRDFLIGLAASRRTPYTVAGLQYAKAVGAKTAFIVCNTTSQLSDREPTPDILIELEVGPEVITGSTRMKSGTAQKMTLNMISTTAMVLLGKTYGNLMVDLQARSEKLAARSRKILMDLFEITSDRADQVLRQADGLVKVAVVMLKYECDAASARDKLNRANGFISKIE